MSGARTFGERFLDELQRQGKPAGDWSRDVLAAVRRAGRSDFVMALSRAAPQVAKDLTIAAHTREPEDLARRFVQLMIKKTVPGAGVVDVAVLCTVIAAMTS